MKLCVTKGGNLHYVSTFNVIWVTQKTEYFVYRLLGVLAVWCNVISCIWWSIDHHFISLVDMLVILMFVVWPGDSSSRWWQLHGPGTERCVGGGDGSEWRGPGGIQEGRAGGPRPDTGLAGQLTHLTLNLL